MQFQGVVLCNRSNLFRLLHTGDIDPIPERLNHQGGPFVEIGRGPAVKAIVPGVRDVTLLTGDDRLYQCLRLRLLSSWTGRNEWETLAPFRSCRLYAFAVRIILKMKAVTPWQQKAEHLRSIHRPVSIRAVMNLPCHCCSVPDWGLNRDYFQLYLLIFGLVHQNSATTEDGSQKDTPHLTRISHKKHQRNGRFLRK